MSSSSDLRRPRVLKGGQADLSGIGRLDDLRDQANRSRVNPEYLAAVTAEAFRVGQSEGHSAGFQVGYQDGLLAAEAEIAQMRLQTRTRLVELAETIAGVRAADRLRLDAVQDLIAEAAVVLAKIVVGHELQSMGSDPAAVLARALDLVGTEPTAVVHLNPEDAQAVRSAMADGNDVRIVPNPEVGPGGCLVDLGEARIDASLLPALERARDALEDQVR